MPPPVRPKKEKPAATVSKSRGRPTTKSSAKSKGKLQAPISRKRAAPKNEDEGDERPLKASRTQPKANTRIKMGASGSSSKSEDVSNIDTSITSITKKPTPEDIIMISDDDDDFKPVPKSELPEMLRATNAQREANKVPMPGTSSRPTAPVASWEFPKAESPDDVSDLTPGIANEAVIREKNRLVEELEKARQDLQTAQDTVKRRQQELEKKHADTQLDKHRAEQKSQQELAKLTLELTAERQACRAAIEERDQLRVQLQGALSAKDAQQARHRNELQALQVRYDQEVEGRKQDEKTHAEILEDVLKSQAEKFDPRLQALEDDKARLTKEVETLKTAATAFRQHQTLSPVPSQSSSTDEEKREDNVRKMYIKTKRQYDILHSVANNLATCTRSMDLSSFGEFGVYMKKLRSSLDLDDGSASTRQALVLRKMDDEDDWGSQRSTR